jgi:hypothetical protein
MPRPLTRTETAELAGSIRDLLAMVQRDELDATAAMIYRLQGALAALETVLGERSGLLERLRS